MLSNRSTSPELNDHVSFQACSSRSTEDLDLQSDIHNSVRHFLEMEPGPEPAKKEEFATQSEVALLRRQVAMLTFEITELRDRFNQAQSDGQELLDRLQPKAWPHVPGADQVLHSLLSKPEVLSLGSLVTCKYKLPGGRVTEESYPGQIVSKNKDGTYDVAYEDDGYTWAGVPPQFIQPRAAAPSPPPPTEPPGSNLLTAPPPAKQSVVDLGGMPQYLTLKSSGPGVLKAGADPIHKEGPPGVWSKAGAAGPVGKDHHQARPLTVNPATKAVRTEATRAMPPAYSPEEAKKLENADKLAMESAGYIMEGMRREPSRIEAQVKGFKALTELIKVGQGEAFHGLSQAQKEIMRLDRETGALTLAVRRFASEEDFAVRALKLIGRLGSWAETEDSEQKLAVLRDLSWADLMKQVLQVHARSVEVQREGVYAMGMWAWSDVQGNVQKLAALFCSMGVIEKAVAALPCRLSWRLTQTLYFFIKASVEVAGAVIRANGVVAMLEVLSDPRSSALDISHSLAALKALAEKGGMYWQNVRDQLSDERILAAMQTFSASDEVQGAGRYLLHTLYPSQQQESQKP